MLSPIPYWPSPPPKLTAKNRREGVSTPIPTELTALLDVEPEDIEQPSCSGRSHEHRPVVKTEPMPQEEKPEKEKGSKINKWLDRLNIFSRESSKSYSVLPDYSQGK